MTIIYEPQFYEDFTDIYDFISLDSLNRANDFTTQLRSKISYLIDFPYKYRKSHYFTDDHIRDYIFKGYVIPYKVDMDKNTLSILGIIKYKESLKT